MVKKIKRKIIYGYKFEKRKGDYQRNLQWKCIYEFNRKGYLERKLSYYRTSNGKIPKLSARGFYNYDEHGNLISYEDYDIKRRLGYNATYEYDTQNRKIKSQSYFYNHKEKITTVYKYNSAGKLIYEMISNNTGEYELHTYEYDKKNRVVKEQVQGSGCIYDCVYEYSKSRVITKYSSGIVGVRFINSEEIYKSYSPEGNLVDMIESRYDKFGNTIFKKRTHFHCNCNGVFEDPLDLEIIKYKYY